MPDRNGKIFYTSITSLSHISKESRVISRERLLDTIWGYDYFGDEKIVNTHIKNIRKKLGVNYIETMRGAGYKIEKENQ